MAITNEQTNVLDLKKYISHLDRDKKRMSRIFIVGDPPPSPEQKSTRLFYFLSRYRVHIAVFFFLAVVVSLCIFFLNQNKTTIPPVIISSSDPVVLVLPVATEKSNHTVRNILIVVISIPLIFVALLIKFEILVFGESKYDRDLIPTNLNSVENITTVFCMHAAMAQGVNMVENEGKGIPRILHGNDLIEKRQAIQKEFSANIQKWVNELGERPYINGLKWKDLKIKQFGFLMRNYNFEKKEDEELFKKYRELKFFSGKSIKDGENTKKMGAASFTELTAWAAIKFRNDPVVIDVVKLIKKNGKVTTKNIETIDPNGWLTNPDIRHSDIKFITEELTSMGWHVRYICIPDKINKRIIDGEQHNFTYVEPEEREKKIKK